MIQPKLLIVGVLSISVLARAGEQEAISIKKISSAEIVKTNGPTLKITGAAGRDHANRNETSTKDALLTSVAGQWFVGCYWRR